RRETSLSGSALVFETSIRIVILSPCLPYAHETCPHRSASSTEFVCLFGVATGDGIRGRRKSSTARKTDLLGCNSPSRAERRSDCPLKESESSPRGPTEKSKPRFAAGD